MSEEPPPRKNSACRLSVHEAISPSPMSVLDDRLLRCVIWASRKWRGIFRNLSTDALILFLHSGFHKRSQDLVSLPGSQQLVPSFV